MDLRLGMSDEAVVYFSRPASYRDALRFDMTAVIHKDSFESRHPVGLVDIGEYPTGESPPDEFLRLRVEFADGRSASNLNDDELAEPPDIALWQLSGESGGGYYRYEWYLWPLPKAGDLVFVCSWPAFGIDETRTTISGDAVREAALRARNIWS
jgi:hypothetical protein